MIQKRRTSTTDAQGPRRTFISMIQLSRPHTCFAGALSTIVGAHLYGHLDSGAEIVAATAMVTLLIIASNAFNDAVDAPTDALLKPHRPIPSGRISPRSAVGVAATCFSLALASAAALGAGILALVVGIVFASYAYSRWLKRIPLVGNTIVGSTSATPIVLGALAADHPIALPLAIGACLALYQTFYEALKTLRDVEEDAAAGIATIGSLAPRFTTLCGTFCTQLVVAALCAVLVITAGFAPTAVALAAGLALPNAVAAVLISMRAPRDRVNRAFIFMRLGWFPGLIALYLFGPQFHLP